MAVPADVRAYVTEHNLTSRSSSRAGARTVVVAALYLSAMAIGFLVDRSAVWVLVWSFQGCVLVSSYSAMHEAAHATLFRSRRANRVAGVLWASTILVNWSMWRSFHLEHHAHTGSERDPKLKHKLEITRRRHYLLLPIGGLAFMAELWVQSLGTLVGRFPAFGRTQKGRAGIRIDAALLLALTVTVSVLLVVAPSLVVKVWLAPLLVTFCVALPATGVSEHYRCSLDGEVFATTRSVRSNRLFRFLVWNNNFHVAHHLVPSVPFHHAPTLHAYLEPRVEHFEPSYTAFHLGILRDCGRKRDAALVTAD